MPRKTKTAAAKNPAPEAEADARRHTKRNLGEAVGLHLVSPSIVRSVMEEELRRCAQENPASQAAAAARTAAEAETKGLKKDLDKKIANAARRYETTLDAATPNLSQNSRYAAAAVVQYVVGHAFTAILAAAQADGFRTVRARHALSADYAAVCPLTAAIVQHSEARAALAAEQAAIAAAKQAAADGVEAPAAADEAEAGPSGKGSHFTSMIKKLKEAHAAGAAPLPDGADAGDIAALTPAQFATRCRLEREVKEFLFGKAGVAVGLVRSLVRSAYVRMLKAPQDKKGRFSMQTLDVRQLFGAVLGGFAFFGLDATPLRDYVAEIISAADALGAGDQAAIAARALLKAHGGDAGAAAAAAAEEVAAAKAEVVRLHAEAANVSEALAAVPAGGDAASKKEYKQLFKSLNAAKDRCERAGEDHAAAVAVAAAVADLAE